MNKEDHEGLELIKEFLLKNGFKGTLECLEKEETYKNVTEKKGKVNKSKKSKIFKNN
jgi:hypothetical protein